MMRRSKVSHDWLMKDAPSAKVLELIFKFL